MTFGKSLIVIVFLTCVPVGADEVKNPTKEDYRKHAMRREGNLERGKALFGDKRALCAECHTVDGSRSKAGPDLAAAGDKFSRADIIKSVMQPSATIMTGYSTEIVTTKDGSTFSGTVKGSSATELVLAAAGSVRHRVSKADIRERTTSPASLMPEGLHAKLSKDEFADLVAYVESLKQPASKVANESGTPWEIPQLSKPVTLEPVFGEKLDFEKPVWFGEHPVIGDTFVILEKSRLKISLLERAGDGTEKQSTFVVIPDEVYVTADEGVLGMAFHPKFAENRKYYFIHETKEGARRGMKIGEREASADLRSDSGKPTRTVMEFEVATQFHHGGGLEFGPDGFFYIGMGDGGPQEDPQGHAQDLTSYSGKLMRIDVDRRDTGMAYAIPKDNPFVDHANPEVRREIYAYGLRQPWRFSWDPANNDLWVGDVGQDRFEEVAIVRKGENHGWNVFEGFELFSTVYRNDDLKLIPPIISFRRRHGVSITAGYVMRPPAVAEDSTFNGVYVCADYQSKRLWGITQENRKLVKIREIGKCEDRVVAFGRDRKGGLYAIGYDKGIIYRVRFDGAVFE